MVLPAQFQLDLELTNIVNPVSQAVSALGSLALVDAIRKSGSDVITETKLASWIGRHRIDPIIKTHFREAVSKADQSVISRYVDIILESGSGPTVQESLKNPALFSMVIQLSALAFSQEDEPLSNAIVEAIGRIVQESGRDHDLVPDYVALLGTVRACQQQTVAFRWSCLFESVEYKIQEALRPAKGNTPKRRKVATTTYSAESAMKRWQSLQQRCLPFPVLQALLMWLQALQSLPENRLLHLRCDSGISTVVVWCYHILGLSLVVKIGGCEIRFGDAPASIIVEESEVEEVGATLMDPKGSSEPLFTLTDNDGNPIIGSEIRAEAYGYGREVLKRAGIPQDDTQHCLGEVIAESLKIARRSSNYLPRCAANDASTEAGEDKASSGHLEPYFPTEERILQAGRFVFAQSLLDLPRIERLIVSPVHRKGITWQRTLSRLVAVLVTFARITENDLEMCIRMPLSLSVLELSDWAWDQPPVSDPRDIDLLISFEILSHLLLGHMFSQEYVRPAVLISGWGWSIFFNSVDAVDPADISINTMRVLCGVPTLRGFRRARIIDGPTKTRVSFTKAKTINKDPRIDFFPGISTARRGTTLIGYHSDAFQVTQTFNWRSMGRIEKKHILGFRQMQEQCLQTDLLANCQHDTIGSNVPEWVDNNSHYPNCGSRLLSDNKRFDPHEARTIYTGNWPHDSATLGTSLERVFTKNALVVDSAISNRKSQASASPAKIASVWFFYVSASSAARWLQLDDMCNYCVDGPFQLMMRGRHTCIECATNRAGASSKNALLLL